MSGDSQSTSSDDVIEVVVIASMLACTMTTGKYFNRGVMALDSPYIGHVVKETFDKIVVFGEGYDRYDIPKSEIQILDVYISNWSISLFVRIASGIITFVSTMP